MTTVTRRTFMLTARRIDLVKKGVDQNGNPSELYKVMADIPEFESQYEYGITNVPGQDAQRMTQGESYCVVLEMGRLKTGKESDTPYLYNYWWNWKGFGSPENIEAAATQPIARAASSNAPLQRREDHLTWVNTLQATQKFMDGMENKISIEDREWDTSYPVYRDRFREVYKFILSLQDTTTLDSNYEGSQI